MHLTHMSSVTNTVPETQQMASKDGSREREKEGMQRIRKQEKNGFTLLRVYTFCLFHCHSNSVSLQRKICSSHFTEGKAEFQKSE